MATLGTGAIIAGFWLGPAAGYAAWKNGPDRGFGLAALCVTGTEIVALVAMVVWAARGG